jgi:hypothetical protein
MPYYYGPMQTIERSAALIALTIVKAFPIEMLMPPPAAMQPDA